MRSSRDISTAGRHDRPGARGLVALVVCLAMVTTACDQWVGVGYGPARVGHNTVERDLGVDEVDELTEAWSAVLPATTTFDQPVIAEGRVLVAAGEVRAYDLAGVDGCSGAPVVCEPLWSASAGGARWVTVAGGVAYAAGDGYLRAYDLAGEDGCSGAPVVCEPLWSASIGAGGSSPAVLYGQVYVSGDLLYAFDALGATGCAGSPVVCEPLWRSSVGSADGAAVADGVAYVVTGDGVVSAFDALGEEGCASTPTTCEPVRTYDSSIDDGCFPYGCGFEGPPTVADGRLYVLGEECCSLGTGAVRLHVFDATGATGCVGTPTVCERTGSTSVPSDGLPYAQPPVAVADGIVYAGALKVTAFDATTLTRLWGTSGSVASAASVADGVVHTIGLASFGGGSGLRPEARDAAGAVGCSGSPVACAAVWAPPASATVDLLTVAAASLSGPAVAETHVAVRTDRLRIYARS